MKQYKYYVWECWYLSDAAKFLNKIAESDAYLISVGRVTVGNSGLDNHIVTYRSTEELDIEVKT